MGNLLKKYFQRRINNEPISKILESKDFWKYNLYVNSDVLDPRPETELILEKILDIDIKNTLEEKGVNKGISKSGNHSMFFAIFNIYANDYLKIDRSKQIQEWLDFNSNSINSNGFWGNKVNMDYLQFQNGYHQYEIFEYLEFQKK